jgi:iron complex outermembrane receptor protein
MRIRVRAAALGGCAGVLCFGAWTGPAAAEGAATAPAAAPADTLETIIVTARRREENLQQVPTAVTATLGEALRRQRIDTPLEIARTAPALSASGSFSNSLYQFSMRGQTPDFLAFGSFTPTVQTYFNEVAPIFASTAQFFDVSSVQVLRGPQGTLFGRAANGGAVLFAAQAPTDSFDGYVDAQFGRFNERQLKAAVNVPVIPGKLSVRVAGEIARRDGWVHILNEQDFDLNDRHVDAARVSILFTPTDAIRNTFIYNYSNVDQHAGAYFLLAASPTGTASALANAGNTAYKTFLTQNPDLAALPGVAGGLQSYLPVAKALAPWSLYSNVPSSALRFKERINFLSNTTEADLGGGVKLKNILGYQTVTQTIPFNPDGSPLPVFDAAAFLNAVPVNFGQDADQLSEELQVLGDGFGQRLNWIVGGYYQKNGDAYPGRALANVAFGFLPGTARQTLTSIDRKNEAIFAQATWKATDALQITAGVRRTWDRVLSDLYLPVATTNSRGVVVTPTVCANDRTEPFSLDAPACQGATSDVKGADDNWMVSVDYRPTSDVLFYLASRHGYQPGGVTTNSTLPRFREFGPSKITDIEGGLKGDFSLGGVPTRLNLAIYHQWLTDTQRSTTIVDPRTNALVTLTLNAQEAEATGAEGELRFKFNDIVGLTAFADYIDAKYNRFLVPNLGLDPSDPRCAAAATKPVCNVVVLSQTDLSANPFPLTPKSHFGATLDASWPLRDGLGEVRASVSYYHQDTFTYAIDMTANPLAVAGAQDLVSGQVEWRNVFGRPVDISIYGKNLTDQTYLTGGVSVQRELGIAYGTYGEPRTYGIELRYRFGASAER